MDTKDGTRYADAGFPVAEREPGPKRTDALTPKRDGGIKPVRAK
jgi:hypothetical protein